MHKKEQHFGIALQPSAWLSTTRWSRVVSVSALAFLVCTMFTAMEGTAVANDSEFILLKSGKVLEGTVTTSRHGTRIDFPMGDYILVPSARFEKSFESMRDLVRYKAAVTPLSIREQSRLLTWLVEYEQLEMAELQLIECQKAEVPIDVADWKTQIAKAKATQETTPVSSESSKEMGSWRDLSKASFTKNVQHHFVTGCALSGCHDSNSKNKFRLYSTFAKPIDEAQTEKNFLSASQFLQSDEQTVLLHKMVMTSHGRLTSPVYPRPGKPYLAIVTWINSTRNAMPRRIANQSREGKAVSLPQIEKSAMKNRPKTLPVLTPNSRANTRQNKMKYLAEKSKPDGIPAQANGTDPFATLSDKSFSDLDSMLDSFQPRDEFDPEIFNRRQKEKFAHLLESSIEPLEMKQPITQTPSRLISPDSSKSKKR